MKKMVKEVLLILVAVIVLITLSGCARVNYEVNVNKDGSADVSYIIGIEKETLNSMGYSEESLGTGMFDDMKNDAEEEGYQIEDYNDEQLFGFKASKHLDNFSDYRLNISNESTEDKEKEVIFEKKLLDTKISQNSKVNLSNDTDNENNDNDETESMSNMIMQQAKFSYKITLPFKAGNNNATTVSEDGKTLEWILTPGEINEVYFEASENLNVVLLGGICALVVIVIVIIILIGTKENKNTRNKEIKITPNKTQNTMSSTTKKEEDKKADEVKEKNTEKKETVKKPSETKKNTATKKSTTTKKADGEEKTKKEE